MERRKNHLLKRIEKMPYHSRTIIGIALIIGGVFWFLPVLGIWMIPLGLLVLSTNFHWARRGFLSLNVCWRRFKRSRSKKRV